MEDLPEISSAHLLVVALTEPWELSELEFVIAKQVNEKVRSDFLPRNKCPAGYMRLNNIKQVTINMVLNCQIDM